jgi:phosphoglycerol transferase MdoB-like AlkP superfamily enzyme
MFLLVAFQPIGGSLSLFEQSALRRFRLVFALGTACVAVGALLRAVLWWRFRLPAAVSDWALPAILAGGLLIDLVEATYLLAPLVIYTALLPDRLYYSKPNRLLLAAGSWLTLFLLAFLACAEVYFFQEFDARFNLVAFDYLAYPTEVAGDVWQDYPVLRIGLASAIFATAGLWMIRRRRADEYSTTLVKRPQPMLLHWSALLLVALFYPTDLLSLSSNRVANELVQNGFPARADGLGKLNVVLVSSESFGAEFSRLYGSAQDLTPNFDSFAQQSLWFSNTYASGTRTVRGLEALTSSIPPIPTVLVLRRPGNEGIATWGAIMRSLGYHTSFLYGGYGYFDNMNYFFGSNGFEVLDRNAIDSVRFDNVWGVSDEDLFDRSLAHFNELHAAGEPFFSIIMTTSNHKPFTLRPGLDEFGIAEQGGGRPAGVHSAWRRTDPATDLRDTAAHLFAQARQPATCGHADDADRRCPDGARPARTALRSPVLRTGLAFDADRIPGCSVQS